MQIKHTILKAPNHTTPGKKYRAVPQFDVKNNTLTVQWIVYTARERRTRRSHRLNNRAEKK